MHFLKYAPLRPQNFSKNASFFGWFFFKFDFKYRKTWKQSDGTMYKRKGKARTTKRQDYLLAHDLDKKAPRNISYQRLLWISVGKKIWGVSQFRLADEHIRLYVLNPTKYSHLKNLLRGNLDGSTMQ